jgi:hypothetical protein
VWACSPWLLWSVEDQLGTASVNRIRLDEGRRDRRQEVVVVSRDGMQSVASCFHLLHGRHFAVEQCCRLLGGRLRCW